MPASKALSKEAAARAMRAAPMFSALSPKALHTLLARGLTRLFKAGEVIFQPGERADRFCVVLGGRVKVYQISPRGDEQILHLYGPGRTFGEAAMWSGGAFPAFAEPVEDARLLIITQATLRRAIAADPDLAMGIMAGLSAKLREFVRLIEELSLKEVPARLAGALLAESKKAGARKFRMRQTKRALAAHLGTIPETMSRALRKLKSAKLIDVQGSTITILDAEGLRKFSEGG
ncbi:MAG: Crp/Fnr family transcriptional regulator [Elusimicrobiota bacterium]